MKPRYDKGTKVRVRMGDKAAYTADPDIKRYDNTTGTVVDCQTVVGFSVWSAGFGTVPAGPDLRLFMYTVEVEGGIILAGLVENYLEEHLAQ